MGLTTAAETFIQQYADFLASRCAYPDEAAKDIPTPLVVDLAYAVKVGFDAGRRLEIERAEVAQASARAQAENEWVVWLHGGRTDYDY